MPSKLKRYVHEDVLLMWLILLELYYSQWVTVHSKFYYDSDYHAL